MKFIPSALILLCAFFRKTCLGNCSGVSFIDSTSLEVCLNQRIGSHKMIAGQAEREKTSTGWFNGLKLHLVINDRGELLSVLLAPGNIDDRKRVPKLVHKLFDKVFGDKGYNSKPLFELLRQTFSVTLVTKLKSNSKSKIPMNLVGRFLLRKWAVVESVIDQLKNISQIKHSRLRIVNKFLTKLLCGLNAYARQSKKPSLGREMLASLPA